MEDFRQAFKTIYKAGMILVTAVLVTGAVAAWWYSTPANQLMLIAGILGMLALISGLSITKLDDQDERAATYRSIIEDVRRHANFSVQSAEPGTGPPHQVPQGVSKIGGISVSFAEPEVHHVDSTLLDTAKRMAGDGAPIDDICRAIDRDHDTHDPIHQEAFRRIVKRMIEQG